VTAGEFAPFRSPSVGKLAGRCSSL
jgi:hypothetical protein